MREIEVWQSVYSCDIAHSIHTVSHSLLASLIFVHFFFYRSHFSSVALFLHRGFFFFFKSSVLKRGDGCCWYMFLVALCELSSCPPLARNYDKFRFAVCCVSNGVRSHYALAAISFALRSLSFRFAWTFLVCTKYTCSFDAMHFSTGYTRF